MILNCAPIIRTTLENRQKKTGHKFSDEDVTRLANEVAVKRYSDPEQLLMHLVDSIKNWERRV